LRLTHTPSAKPNPILNVVAHLVNNGYSEATVEWTDKALHHIRKSVSLDNPEGVKAFIARKTSQSYKCNLALAYDRYCKFYQLEFQSSSLIKEKKDKPDFCNVKKITIKEDT